MNESRHVGVTPDDEIGERLFRRVQLRAYPAPAEPQIRGSVFVSGHGFSLAVHFLSFLGALFLDLLSGYGYKVGRCFFAYAFVIGVFAMIYHLLGSHPAWNEAIVISMTAFHGRGFFPDQFKPGDLQALVAAIEAFVGLLIEVTFIATLTQRLFRK